MELQKIQPDWYENLITDLKHLAFEGIVKTKHAIGKRILADELKFGKPEYGSKKIESLARDLDIHPRDIYYCVQFAKKFPEIEPPVQNLSWREIRRNYLPASIHFSSESTEWYTPETIIECTLAVMGEIDLDPCSDVGEKPNIPARQIFTKHDNGLEKAWMGRVYMNPPYGRELPLWTDRLCNQYAAGNTSQAIALIPARTDTEWFRQLKEFQRCFIWGRLKFSGQDNSAPFPSMVVYMGNHADKFAEEFRNIGDIYEIVR